jgi:predicted dehydrogenase
MLRVAIIGAGVMGTNHARILRMIPDAEVSLVVDNDPLRGSTLATASGAEFATSLDAVAAHAEAAIVATPTQFHEEIGVTLLDAGLHILVEKPLASTVEGCQNLLAMAEQRQRLLMVGHIERFNPAILELENVLDDVIHLDIARIGPRAPRVTDDVVLDLMIHDLDLALALTSSPLVRMSAMGRGVDSAQCQLACALLQFEDGVVANITASHLGQNKIRRLNITQRESFVSVDLIRQDISVNRVNHTEFVSAEGTLYRQTGVTEIPFLEHRGEPLMLELRHFIDCLASGKRPRVSGEDGMAAVALALKVQALVRES